MASACFKTVIAVPLPMPELPPTMIALTSGADMLRENGGRKNIFGGYNRETDMRFPNVYPRAHPQLAPDDQVNPASWNSFSFLSCIWLSWVTLFLLSFSSDE